MYFYFTFILWLFMLHTHINDASWATSMAGLPRADTDMAIGVYNTTIFLIGGDSSPRQLIEHNVNTQTYQDHGLDALAANVGGEGQFWTSNDHIIYIIDQNTGNSFNTFDMSTTQFTTDWQSVSFPKHVGATGCLSSAPQYLYVTGGNINLNAHNYLQILSLSTYQWATVSGTPQMNFAREKHACVVHNNHLWAIGGLDGSHKALDSIEQIQITDIMQNAWNLLTNTLTLRLDFLRVVAWGDTLYVTGGNDRGSNINRVHLIDVNTLAVTLSPDNLPQSIASHSPVIHDGILYIFGGGMGTDWMYYVLPQLTLDPTTSTAEPSKVPTLNPSKIPTNNPTDPPTVNPSILPSDSPFKAPTLNPSILPSSLIKAPTMAPTFVLYTRTSRATVEQTLFTISVDIHGCSQTKQQCDISEDQMNTILIAVLDETAQVLSIDILNDNEIVIIIAFPSDAELDKDRIPRAIQAEMSVEYGDVDVTMTEIEEGFAEEGTNSNSISDVTLGVIIGASSVVMMILSFCLCGYFIKRKTAQRHVDMTVNVPGTSTTDEHEPGATTEVTSTAVSNEGNGETYESELVCDGIDVITFGHLGNETTEDIEMAWTNEGPSCDKKEGNSDVSESDNLDDIYADVVDNEAIKPPQNVLEKKQEKETKGDLYYDEFHARIHQKRRPQNSDNATPGNIADDEFVIDVGNNTTKGDTVQ